MNLTIDKNEIYDTSRFYDENGTFLSDKVKYDLSDNFSTMIQKHNALVMFNGNNINLKTDNKNNIVDAINESLETGLKYALIFGM